MTARHAQPTRASGEQQTGMRRQGWLAAPTADLPPCWVLTRRVHLYTAAETPRRIGPEEDSREIALRTLHDTSRLAQGPLRLRRPDPPLQLPRWAPFKPTSFLMCRLSANTLVTGQFQRASLTCSHCFATSNACLTTVCPSDHHTSAQSANSSCQEVRIARNEEQGYEKRRAELTLCLHSLQGCYPGAKRRLPWRRRG